MYSITAKESDNLLFSCLGYEDTILPVGKSTVINVTMNEDSEELQSVVVTGYQTISKERATGSFDILSKNQIEKPTGNISSRLIGAAPGLSYSQDVYGNPTFLIRGESTFSAGTAPLVVIDGFPVESQFESLNPNDVESITILKDAAAASIWGAKSANGVIVITTKNASVAANDKPVVNVEYSGFYKVSPRLNLDYALSQASTSDIIDYEVNNYSRWSADLFWPEESDYYGGNDVVYNLLNEARLGHMSQSDAMAKINALRSVDNYDQIQEYLLQNASTHQENLSITIGTKRSQSAFSVLYQNDDRIEKLNQSKKLNVSFRNRTNLFKWLDFNINGTYNYTRSNNSGIGIPDLSRFENIADANGNLIRYDGGIYLPYVERYVTPGSFPYEDWTWNPVEEAQNRNLMSYSTLARIQGGLTFKILKGLSIDTKAQYELIQGRSHNYYNENTFYVRDMVNEASTWDRTSGKVTQNLPSGGILSQSHNQTGILTLRAQANFNRTFAEKHSFAAVAGVEGTDNVYQKWGHPNTYGYNDNTLTVGTFPNGPGGTGNLALKNWQGSNQTFGYVNSFSYTTDRYFSAFANASYTYDGKYTVSASARTDASNLITDDPAYRYAPFWSVGASWQLGKENFMKNVSWVDVLTLRATYGHNGNVDKSTTFKPLINPSATPNANTKEYTATMSSYGNPALRWERTKTFDVGVDFALLDGKLHGKFDVYNKKSIDLISEKTLPYVQGTTKLTMNCGEVSNKGFELELGSTLPINRDIVWDGTLMLSYNKNRITARKYTPSSPYQPVYSGGSYGWIEGYDMNTLWSYEYGGLINNGSETSPDMQPTLVGVDGKQWTFGTWPSGTNWDNICYDNGTTVAPVNVSFSTGLRIYDFEVSMILTGKFGHVFRRESFNYPAVTGGHFSINSKYTEIKDCDPSERVPLPLKDNEGRYYFWDRFWPFMSYLTENASLIRVQELYAAYNLPKHCTNWLGINSLKVFVEANNPCNIFFNKWNEDPEFPRGSYPLQSSYMFGIKCNF